MSALQTKQETSNVKQGLQRAKGRLSDDYIEILYKISCGTVTFGNSRFGNIFYFFLQQRKEIKSII